MGGRKRPRPEAMPLEDDEASSSSDSTSMDRTSSRGPLHYEPPLPFDGRARARRRRAGRALGGALLLAACHGADAAKGANGGGYLAVPPSRNYLAYTHTSVPSNEAHPSTSLPEFEPSPHSLNSGGGTCGATNGGDGGTRDYDAPQSRGGSLMPLNVQGIYVAGGTIQVSVNLFDTSAGGHFEFSVCPLDYPAEPTEDCFGRYPLEFVADEYYGAPKDEQYPNRAYVPFESAFEGSLKPRYSATDGPGGQKMIEFTYTLRLPSDAALNVDLDMLEERGVPNGDAAGSAYATTIHGHDRRKLQDDAGIWQWMSGAVIERVAGMGRALRSYLPSLSSNSGHDAGKVHKLNGQTLQSPGRQLQGQRGPRPDPASGQGGMQPRNTPAPPTSAPTEPQWYHLQHGDIKVPSTYETVLISSLSTDGNGTTTIVTLNGDVTVIEGGPKLQPTSTLTYGSKAVYGTGIDLELLPDEVLDEVELPLGGGSSGKNKADDEAEGGDDGEEGAAGESLADSFADSFASAFASGTSAKPRPQPVSLGAHASSEATTQPNQRYVLLRWHYVTARDCHPKGYEEYLWPSSWGNWSPPADGECNKKEARDEEEYWNCAEILILGPSSGGEDAGAEDEPLLPQASSTVDAQVADSIIELLKSSTMEAVDDGAVTGVDVPVRVDVAANDGYTSDYVGDGLALIVTEITVPALHGDCQVVTTSNLAHDASDSHQVQYSPDQGFVGWDHCTYKICLWEVGLGNNDVCDEAKVKIKVDASWEPEVEPVATTAVPAATTEAPVATEPSQAEEEDLPVETTVVATATTTVPYSTSEPEQLEPKSDVAVEVVAEDDEATTAGSTPVSVDVTANDFTSGTQPLTVTEVNKAKHGTCELNGNNVKYTPDDGFEGVDRCAYMVCSEGECDKGRVEIDVLGSEQSEPEVQTTEPTEAMEMATEVEAIRPVFTIPANKPKPNRPAQDAEDKDDEQSTKQDESGGAEPEMVYAEDEVVATSKNTPIIVDVLHNDFVKGMGDLTLREAGGAENGNCKVTRNNRLRYIPKRSFTGTDHCAYIVCHGEICDEGIVAIKVTNKKAAAKPMTQQLQSSGAAEVVTNWQSSGQLSLTDNNKPDDLLPMTTNAVVCKEGAGGGRNLRFSQERRLPRYANCVGSSLVTRQGELTYTSTYRDQKKKNRVSLNDITARLRTGGSSRQNSAEDGSYIETVITVPAYADAVIMPGFPDKCFGSVPSMLISSASSEAGLHETVVRFETSEVDASICDGGISSARIYLYSLAHSSHGGTFVTTSDKSWLEDQVTWNSAPRSDGIVLTDLGPVEANQWYQVDVLSALSVGEALSIRILSNEEGGTSVATYASKDFSDVSMKPTLKITCISSNVEGVQ